MDTASIPANAPLALRVIAAHDSAALAAAYDLLAQHSWSKDEIENIDLLGELRSKCEHRVGLYRGHELVGFAAVGTGASPDLIDNDQMWIGYLVTHPSIRRGRSVFRLCESCLDFVTSHDADQVYGARRVFACSETITVQRALARFGWVHVRTAQILGDDGKPLGETTEVFEWMPHALWRPTVINHQS